MILVDIGKILCCYIILASTLLLRADNCKVPDWRMGINRKVQVFLNDQIFTIFLFFVIN